MVANSSATMSRLEAPLFISHPTLAQAAPRAGSTILVRDLGRTLPLQERARRFRERLECLFAGDGPDWIVEIPRALRVFRLLDLDQMHVVHHAPVLTDMPAMREEVFDRHLPHLAVHGLGGVRPCCLHRF